MKEQPKRATRKVRRSWIAFTFSSLCFSAAVPAAPPGTDAADKLIAIIAASEPEAESLRPYITSGVEQDQQGWKCLTGRIGRRPVVLCVTGVGKVNVACALTLLLEHHHPQLVVMIGTAGAVDPRRRPGDVVIGKTTVQSDVGVVTPGEVLPKPTISPIDGSEEPQYFEGDSRAISILSETRQHSNLKLVQGVIASGDVFVSSAKAAADLRQRTRADAVDMESAAAAQVCWQQQVPFLAIRAITDRADVAAPGDVRANTSVAMRGPTEAALAVCSKLGETK